MRKDYCSVLKDNVARVNAEGFGLAQFKHYVILRGFGQIVAYRHPQPVCFITLSPKLKLIDTSSSKSAALIKRKKYLMLLRLRT